MKRRTVALTRLYSYDRTAGTAFGSPDALGKGATVMTRSQRMKMQRRMQRRIRLVVEERRMARSQPSGHLDGGIDADATIEIPRTAIGRVAIEQA